MPEMVFAYCASFCETSASGAAPPAIICLPTTHDSRLRFSLGRHAAHRFFTSERITQSASCSDRSASPSVWSTRARLVEPRTQLSSVAFQPTSSLDARQSTVTVLPRFFTPVTLTSLWPEQPRGELCRSDEHGEKRWRLMLTRDADVLDETCGAQLIGRQRVRVRHWRAAERLRDELNLVSLNILRTTSRQLALSTSSAFLRTVTTMIFIFAR